LLLIFKPKLVAVVLQQADIAHGSYNGYHEIVRQNDAALGDLWKAVKAEPELRDSTAILVCPEFGRDRDLNSRRGLDHGDGSEDLEYVAATCWGPDFAKARVVGDDVQVIDLCPTVCELLGANAPKARGKRLPQLFA
jgi:arylsulfatase A-like enzyme